MKVIKTENRFKTGFKQLKIGFKKSGFNISTLNQVNEIYIHEKSNTGQQVEIHV